MALKYRSTEVFLKPDVRHKSKLISKFINCLMHDGKKSTAEACFYRALDILEEKVPGVDPLKAFETCLDNVRPTLEVRSKRVGGATYQVPVEVPRNRATALAIRWILEAARSKKGKPMHVKLAAELVDAYNKTGAAFTQRENVHKMAEANKAFAHFAW
jgi:small subunit ribosomal protein S7